MKAHICGSLLFIVVFLFSLLYLFLMELGVGKEEKTALPCEGRILFHSGKLCFERTKFERAKMAKLLTASRIPFLFREENLQLR